MNNSKMNNIFVAELRIHRCLRRIFEFLPLSDLITCQKVNWQFKFYADLLGVEELAVSDDKSLCTEPEYWYLTDRQILADVISWCSFASAKSLPPNLTRRLKFLHIHLNDAALLNFERFNHFEQLVHLEVKAKARCRKPMTLTLPELKVLYIRHCQFGSFVLKTPKLEVLACEVLKGIRVVYSRRLKQLSCGYTGVRYMARFKNLQILQCRCRLDDLNFIHLACWKDLKELSVTLDLASKRRAEKFQSWLAKIRNQRTVLGRPDVKLYLNDVLLDDDDQILKQKVSATAHDLHAFWFKNWRSLRRDSYPALTKLSYGELMRLDVDLSSDFFKRFPSIRSLTAVGRVDREQFEWFLQNASSLRVLTLTNTSLDQSLIERLPAITPRLTSLEIYRSEVTSFDFILQFEQLQSFRTDRQLGSLDLAARAFEQLKELVSFRFSTDDQLVKIDRVPRKESYKLSLYMVKHNVEIQITELENLSWYELVTAYDRRGNFIAAAKINPSKTIDMAIQFWSQFPRSQ